MQAKKAGIANWITLIIFVIGILFLVLLTKNQGDLGLTFDQMVFWK